MAASTEPVLIEHKINYLNVNHSVRSWLFTTDHKRIAILFLVSITSMFFVGAIFAGIIRLELITPQGDLVTSDTYNKMFTMHGIIMVFFFLVPSIPATLGNFLVPMMIGARDLAFPRVNLLSWYLYITGAMITLVALISGGVDTGWTFYTPFSSNFSNTHVVMAIVGIFIAGFSSILTGLNFIVTIHTMRAPGMTWMRLPLFLWSTYATAVIMVLGTPVVAITLALVAAEHLFGIGIFNPALGGDPILFQHMFWFYSHPAVYIMILPGMGVVSELVACFSPQACLRLRLCRVRKPGYRHSWISRLGPSLVCLGPVHIRGDGVLVFEFHGCGALRDQGIQLDRDDVQRLHLIGHADALCLRIHRAVHDRRAYRADGCFAGG